MNDAHNKLCCRMGRMSICSQFDFKLFHKPWYVRIIFNQYPMTYSGVVKKVVLVELWV